MQTNGAKEKQDVRLFAYRGSYKLKARSDFSSRVSMFVGSAVFGVVGRPDIFGGGLRRATEGTAIFAAQLTGITILAGVFFRTIEAHFRYEYFSFDTWNDSKRQRASLISAY